jgi:ribosomal protein S18 acetylase RimI-like enzyme
MQEAAEITVRGALTADLDRLAELFDQYRRFYGQSADLALARAFLSKRMQRNESILLVAPANGTIQAFAQLYPTFCSVAGGPLLVLYDLFVAPEARRRGLARALLNSVREHAVAHGAVRIELATARSNVAAQRLYESMGWRRDALFHHYALPLA